MKPGPIIYQRGLGRIKDAHGQQIPLNSQLDIYCTEESIYAFVGYIVPLKAQNPLSKVCDDESFTKHLWEIDRQITINTNRIIHTLIDCGMLDDSIEFFCSRQTIELDGQIKRSCIIAPTVAVAGSILYQIAPQLAEMAGQLLLDITN